MHGTEAVSAWIARWAHLVPAGATVLDVASGRGRHARFFARRGCRVTAVDRDGEALRAIGVGETLVADIENGPWPFTGRTFDAVVVTNYLWRPLLPAIVGSVAPGGVLLYETFAAGNEAHGKPSRPDFLLQPGELLTACASLETIAFEQGFLASPPRVVQRIASVNSRGPHSLESPIPGEKIS
ncbi:class I SAM-dependent methyltransferase [Ramlibacter sp. PS4R-6]|uniref:class I SAM-dependent methyltransferase n=1 Tax=Ramlibacter sp. PS4R-6 TaxID=3133438 RepID=UPI0030A810FE